MDKLLCLNNLCVGKKNNKQTRDKWSTAAKWIYKIKSANMQLIITTFIGMWENLILDLVFDKYSDHGMER